MTLYDRSGNRLYLNAEERAAFLEVARKKPTRDRTICETLHYTGCRPSELIEITRIDLAGGAIALRSLKKRKDLVKLYSKETEPDCQSLPSFWHIFRR